MRKIKKINGFLVVKFNDREKREYEGTALGEYGVIDAEVYTGNLDIDRGAMEYDDADTLEVAVELARGLESEEDITDEPPTYTAAVETNESYTEETVEPAALIEGWTRRLATQVKSKHYPDTDPRTAAHELYGFKMALHQIGFLPESEVITDPDTFGAGRLDGPMPRNPEELLAFVCDELCKNRAGHTQEELDAICAKCPLGQLYEDAEAQDLRIRERSERALREHIEGVRHAEDTVTALLGGHEALAYMDDVVVIAPNKEIAREWLAKIKVFLQERLHLETNQKTKIFYVRQGVNAYGFKIKATHLLLRTESKRREKRRIKRMMEKLQEGTITKAAIVQSVNSWLGFARWACAYNLAKKIFAPYRFIKTEGELPYGAISRNRQARRILQQRRGAGKTHKAVA